MQSSNRDPYTRVGGLSSAWIPVRADPLDNSAVLGKHSFEREVPNPVRRLKTDLKNGYFGENKTDLENVPQSRCFSSYHRTNPAVYLNNKIIQSSI